MDTTTLIAMVGLFATLLGIIAQLNNFKKGFAEQIKSQTARDTKMDGRLDNIEKRLDSIPSTVTSIGTSAFGACHSVAEYHFLSTTPPTLASNSFTSILADCKIYVPYSADHSILEAYQTATNWSTYASYMVEESP